MVGKTLGHYQIVEVLGAGGMGKVHRARDRRLDRYVALKLLPSGTLADHHARKRFRKEALALSRLNHPNIATVYDFDTQEGVDFLVMEYVDGVTLADRLARGALPDREAVRLGAQIAGALVEAHEHGVIHCDLKPSNVMVTPKGQAKVLDFGLARLLQPVIEETTVETLSEEPPIGGGTLPYMPPEQLRGEKVDGRADIYSLGVVLYEVTTGKRPFREEIAPRLTDEILHQAPLTPRAMNSRISPGLEYTILKCLEKDPEDRYQSAEEIEVDLRRLGTSVSTPAARPKLVSRKLRRGAMLAAGISLVALLVLYVGLKVGNVQRPDPGIPGRIESLAVLPLENLMGDPGQDYFVDGMTEALINELAQIRSLRVISRTSVMLYKKSPKPLHEIARELNVDAVIEGSVLRAGDRVAITTRLIDARTDRHLWSSDYERDLRDILALRKEVTRAIAYEIKVTLTPEDEARLARVRRVSPEAQEAYLKGRYFWNTWTEPGVKKAIEYFEEAIEKDPDYAPAYAWLAESYIGLAYLADFAPKEIRPKAKAAAMKALEIDNTLAEGHTALAHSSFLFDWDWSKAVRELERAIELNPSDARTHMWYGECLSRMGRHDEAIVEMRRARELDPMSIFINVLLGWHYYSARQYDKAMVQIQESLKMDSDYWVGHFFLGWVYVRKGMYEDAVAEFRKAITSSGADLAPKAALGYTYAVMGRRDEALNILTELKDLSKRQYVVPSSLAMIHIGLGEKDLAIEWLEKAYEARDIDLSFIREDPTFDSLHSDPRFQVLVRGMGLTP